MKRTLVLLVCLIALSALTTASSAASGRFDAYVAGAGTGREHAFVVGDGLNLVFRDRSAAHTSYRVCWVSTSGASRCWRRRTLARDVASKIFTAAPASTGVYVATWYVGQRAVARWHFTNGLGD